MCPICHLGDTLGSCGGVVEVARARVRCAWAKFKELSPILTVRALGQTSNPSLAWKNGRFKNK